MHKLPNGSGGDGGDASVDGDASIAQGGQGGEGVIGGGGRGGHARVFGSNSTAIGGAGGRGGLGPGQPGGDVAVERDGTFVAGGQGGEASQVDGRGGRGGRAYLVHQFFGLPETPHMRIPYGSPNTEFGRGGDAADTPQYMARRLIIEYLKARHLSATVFFSDEVWYDRTTPIAWLNDQLEAGGHWAAAGFIDTLLRWKMKLEDVHGNEKAIWPGVQA